ncbi:MAG: alkaline phosphatase family protein [Polyangiaceae bacterium]|nr:alkaline phosphatase family protein [Polyangiaceae bacterium]
MQSRRPIVLGLPFLVPLVACGDDETDGQDGGAGGEGGAGGGQGGDGEGGEGGGGNNDPLTTRIAFGSCMHQNIPKPVLDLATDSAPDLFVFLGDNIYGDTTDMELMQAKYDLQGSSAEFQRLRDKIPVIATWDDHDYGANDAGKEYPQKAESKQIFLDFWQEPEGSERRTREGIYTSYVLEAEGGTVRVILLDTRWFRDPLDPATDPGSKNDYQPTDDTTRAFLGEAQWAWLEEELKKPADVRIIATSTQFGHAYNGYESWTNMPHERQRMIDLIRTTGANATIFISGDVHWGELSKLEVEGGYPIYDLTSSGITQTWPFIEENTNRVGDAVPENNYGFVEITWREGDPLITFGIVDVEGTVRVTHEVNASALAF